MSIARFSTGICVFSDACNNIAQSSADKAQTGISNLFVLVSSSAINSDCLISLFTMLISENALLYSPFESIITNFAPLAE